MIQQKRVFRNEKKRRVNWSLKPKTLELLNRYQEEINVKYKMQNIPKTISLGQIIDMIVEQKLVDPIESLREEAKQHQANLMRVTDRITELQEVNKK